MSVEARPSLWRVPAVQRLVGVTLLGFVGFAATLAALPWWAVRGGATVAQAGLVTTAMLTATVLTQTVVPALVARVGSARSLALGLVALGAPSPLLLLSSDLLPLLAVNAVRGTGFAVLTVVGSTLTWTFAPPGRHGETAGIYGLAIGLSGVVVVPASVAVAQQVGFWPVALVATLPVLAVPSALRMARDEEARGAETRDERASDGPGVGDAGRSRGPRAPRQARAVLTVLVPSLVLLSVTLAGSGVVTFLPIERPDGLVAPAALLLFGATGAVSRWRAGALADRVGTRLLLPATAVETALGVAGVGAGLLSGGPGMVLAAAALAGAGHGAVQNLTLVQAFARVEPADTPTASAVWNLCFDGGTAVGAVAVGAAAAALADPAAGDGASGIAAALLLCAVLVLVMAPVGLRTAPARPGAV
ncbi:MFS transporter [Aquipuribacter hungaricus]|uniref:MFS transporter n=1 Tax=Aquipuribacter hungaricus TaxID=545624 RepID=UPI003618688B